MSTYSRKMREALARNERIKKYLNYAEISLALYKPLSQPNDFLYYLGEVTRILEIQKIELDYLMKQNPGDEVTSIFQQYKILIDSKECLFKEGKKKFIL